MSTLKEQFEEAAKSVNSWKPTKTVPDDDKLKIYGLYKQATIGDCNTQRPGLFDLTGKRKWDSWNSYKGISNEDAMKQYIEELDRQKKEFS